MLLVSIAAVRLAVGSGLPTLLLYLGLGLVLGEDALGLDFDDDTLARSLGYAALVVILAEGGLTTPWESIRSVVPAAAALATIGTAVSVGVVGVAAHLLLDVGWQDALLIGAVLAPTDSAAVFSVLRKVPLPPRLGGLLEAESGFNDAPVVILVVALAASSAPTWWELLLLIGYELVLGAVVGLAVGYAGAWGVRRIALPSSGLYPLAVLALCVTAYGAAAVAHGSGFLAVYLAALVLGNVAAAAPVGDPRLRRGDGLAGPDRPVRHAGPAGDAVRAGPSILPGARCRAGAAACWPGRCRCSRRCCRSSCAGRPGTSRPPGPNGCCCPGPACAARCRSCSRRCPPTTTSSTWCSSWSWSSRWCRRRPCRGWRSGSA